MKILSSLLIRFVDVPPLSLSPIYQFLRFSHVSEKYVLPRLEARILVYGGDHDSEQSMPSSKTEVAQSKEIEA
ncbi:hypothetical protein J6590_065063 [Homalodisca vitripennis]|nr:hypothetical protein J6590_065063 [Homalodisca vitripennis]